MCNNCLLHIFFIALIGFIPNRSVANTSEALDGSGIADWLQKSRDASSQGKHQRSLLFADSAFQFIDQLSLEDQVELHFIRGKSLRYTGQNIKSIQQFSLGLGKAKVQEDQAIAHFELGELYFEEKSLDIALAHYEQALRLFAKSDHLKQVRKTQFKAGIVHAQLDHPKAAISLFETVLANGKDDLVQQALCHDELAQIYYVEASFDSAITHLTASNKVYRQLNFSSSLAGNLSQLALIENMRGMHETAISYLNEAAELNLKNEDKLGAAVAYESLAKAYEDLKEWRNAVRMQRKAIELLPSQQTESLANMRIELAKMLDRAGESGEAELAFYDAYVFAEKHQLNKLMEKTLRYKVSFLERKSDIPAALIALKMADSLSQINRQSEIASLKRALNQQKISTETYLKESNDMRTSTENRSDQHYWNIIIIGIVCFVLIIALLFREFSQKRKLSKVLEWKVYKRTRELRKANKELNTYIYKSSHDLRTPLTSIKSLLRLLDKEEHNAASKKYLGLIDSCSEQMDGILVNLSRAVDYKKVDIKVEHIDFNKLKFDLEQKELVGSRELKMIWEIQDLAPFYSDFKLLKVILNRTITNAIDYRKGSEDDFCRVSIFTDEQGATLKVEDNGLGISEKVRDKVFDMFVKGTNKSKGAGLGLYLVKIASEKLHGKINLESNQYQGATLTFRLPNLQQNEL